MQTRQGGLNPKDLWEQIAWWYSPVFNVHLWKESLQDKLWSGSDIYETLYPKLVAEVEIASEFYARFDYSWVLDSESYNFPDEVTYQHISLMALVGIWHMTADEELDNSLFENVCVRYVPRDGLKGSTPFTINSHTEPWQYMVISSAWFKFTTLAIDAALTCIDDGFSIDKFDMAQYRLNSVLTRPFWDEMIIEGIIGNAKCDDILKPQLAEQLKRHFDISSEPKSAKALMQPPELLAEFSLRFLVAHETAHLVSPALVDNLTIDVDEELLADTLALFGLDRINWKNLGTSYAPLLLDADRMSIVCGEVFYFVLSMWVVVENVTGSFDNEPGEIRTKRSKDISDRINNWHKALQHSEFSSRSGVASFFASLQNHVRAFEEYALRRSIAMETIASELDNTLIAEHPELKTHEGMENSVTAAIEAGALD